MSTPRRVRVTGYMPIGYAPIPELKIKIKAYDHVAKRYLDAAGELYEAASGLDTSVRDSVCEGLAHVVHAAYDSQACSVGLDTGSFSEFVEKKTAEWFRSRGCADWFCEAAACLFLSSKREVFHILTRKTKKGHRVMTRVKVA